jgi:hypothetical protein
MRDVAEYLAGVLCRRVADKLKALRPVFQRCAEAPPVGECLYVHVLLRTEDRFYTSYEEWLRETGLPRNKATKKLWEESAYQGGSIKLTALAELEALSRERQREP